MRENSGDAGGVLLYACVSHKSPNHAYDGKMQMVQGRMWKSRRGSADAGSPSTLGNLRLRSTPLAERGARDVGPVAGGNFAKAKQCAMVARLRIMYSCYDSYSYRLWSLANVWSNCQRKFLTIKLLFIIR